MVTLEKWKINSLYLYLRTYFCCYYGICCRIAKTICRVGEIFLTWLLLISMLKEKCRHDSSSGRKQKPCHRAIKRQSANFRIVPKRYLQFHWYCKQPVEGRNSMSIGCSIFSQIFLNAFHYRQARFIFKKVFF